MSYEIIYRNTADDASIYTRNWSAVEGENRFDTEAAAWEAVEQLRELGPEWDENMEYDVRVIS